METPAPEVCPSNGRRLHTEELLGLAVALGEPEPMRGGYRETDWVAFGPGSSPSPGETRQSLEDKWDSGIRLKRRTQELPKSLSTLAVFSTLINGLL